VAKSGGAGASDRSDRRRALFPFLGVLLVGLAVARMPGAAPTAIRTPDALAPERLLAPVASGASSGKRVLVLDARTSRLELERTRDRFDLVTLSLAEHPDCRFVATVEGLRAAKRLLAPGGTFALVVPGDPQWLYERADVTLSEAFQAAPRLLVARDAASQGVVFLQGAPVKAPPDVRESRILLSPTASLATDDGPFFDRPDRALTTRELLVLGGGLGAGLLLALVLLATRGKPTLPLALLGCGLALAAARSLEAGELILGMGEKSLVGTAAGALALALFGGELGIRRDHGRSRLVAWLLAGSLVLAFWAPHEAVLALGLALALVLGGAAVPPELSLGALPALGALLAGGSAGLGLGRVEAIFGLRALPALALLAFALGLALARRGARHA
jgi:hypothetical protein